MPKNPWIIADWRFLSTLLLLKVSVVIVKAMCCVHQTAILELSWKIFRLSDFSKALMLPVVLVIPRLSRLATLATVLARTLNYCMRLVSGWPLAVDFSRHWNDFQS